MAIAFVTPNVIQSCKCIELSLDDREFDEFLDNFENAVKKLDRGKIRFPVSEKVK